MESDLAQLEEPDGLEELLDAVEVAAILKTHAGGPDEEAASARPLEITGTLVLERPNDEEES